MKTYIFSFLFLASALQNTFAQSYGGGLTLGFPQGEFKKELNRTTFGGQLYYLFFSHPLQPFSVGINLGGTNFASESRKEPWSSTIPDVYLNIDRSSNLVNLNLLFRIHPVKMKLRPYAEVLIGGAYAFTETKVTSENKPGEPIAQSTNYEDYIWSYGGGGGIQWKILGGTDAQGTGAIYLDLNVRYMATTAAEYLKEGGIEQVPGQPRVILHPSKSTMDLLTFTLGLHLQGGFGTGEK